MVPALVPYNEVRFGNKKDWTTNVAPTLDRHGKQRRGYINGDKYRGNFHWEE